MIRARGAGKPFTAQAVVPVAAPPQGVWDCQNAPGAGVLLDHRHIRSFPVPGTPLEGVGHQYCTVSRHDGGYVVVTMSEIVEYDPPHRVARKVVNSATPILEAHTIGAIPGGCSYAVRLGPADPRGQRTAPWSRHAKGVGRVHRSGEGARRVRDRARSPYR